MSSTSLPDASSPTVQLAHPTPVQKHLQTLQNSDTWRGALSQEAYLRREEHLANQTLTTNFGITHWILVDTAEPEKCRRVLCGCETIRKRAIVAQGGKTKDVISHCIGNVFCPPENRGHGYAQRMMKELRSALRTHQTRETGMQCLSSALWSDIGKTFYAKYGWEAFPSLHIVVPPATATPATLVYSELPKVRPLYAPDLEPLCVADEQSLRKTLSARPASCPPAIALVPDYRTICWHHAREDFVGTELHGKAPEIKGALIPGLPGQRAWCYWTRMWYNSDKGSNKGNSLHILRLIVEDADTAEALLPQTTNGASVNSSSENGMYALWSEERNIKAIEALLRAAQVQADIWKMEGVEVWNPTPETVEAAKRIHSGAKIVDRNIKSIPSMIWYGGGKEKAKIEWLKNEKYAWC